MIKWRQFHGLFAALVLTIYISSVRAQDVLRQRPNQQQNSAQSIDLSQLANIQLPPQLDSLTPQQLHQLANLRELQIKQQQQQQQTQSVSNNQQGNSFSSQPTVQPSNGNTNAQIPQPGVQPSGANDDGAYNESGSEMEGITTRSAEVAGGNQGVTGANAPQQPTFEVNWNKCPQLEPSESEKNKKTQVITKCLQSAPIPTNLTRENVEAHREQIASCALKIEGWFDDRGDYKYEKAESEIRAKKLEPQIEIQVLKFHVACKGEAVNKFPQEQHKLIEQVQFYQACMDYYISIVCEIEVSVDQ